MHKYNQRALLNKVPGKLLPSCAQAVLAELLLQVKLLHEALHTAVEKQQTE